MNKVIRDGKVALLISPGYGAGWSTWNAQHPQCLYDPKIVEMLEANVKAEELEQYIIQAYPDDFYMGGWGGLEVQWVDQGKKFFVIEFDGSETLLTEDEMMEA